jgi:histidinol-phosphatase
MPEIDLRKAMQVARRAAEAGSAASLAHFRQCVLVEKKADRTPVTQADRDSEEAIRSVVLGAYPEHGFLGEETGTHGDSAEARWIVDPLDGTKGFTRGRTFWGALVALEHRGEIVAGAMALPALGETYWAARGLGAWVRAGDGRPAQLRVSRISSWSDATLSFGEPHVLFRPPMLERLAGLALGAQAARCYGDLAGCALVLRGEAEAWVEAGVQIWDLAPLQILVEEAGGRFTDLEGRPTHGSGSCVASNGLVHEHVLAALAGR